MLERNTYLIKSEVVKDSKIRVETSQMALIAQPCSCITQEYKMMLCMDKSWLVQDTATGPGYSVPLLAQLPTQTVQCVLSAHTR